MQRWFLVLCFTICYISAADIERLSAGQTSFLIKNRSGASVDAYAYSREKHIISGNRTFTFWHPLHVGCVQNRDSHLFIFEWPCDTGNDHYLSRKTNPRIDATIIVKGVFRSKEHRIHYVVKKQEDNNKQVELLVKNPYKKSHKKDTVEKT